MQLTVKKCSTPANNYLLTCKGEEVIQGDYLVTVYPDCIYFQKPTLDNRGTTNKFAIPKNATYSACKIVSIHDIPEGVYNVEQEDLSFTASFKTIEEF